MAAEGDHALMFIYCLAKRKGVVKEESRKRVIDILDGYVIPEISLDRCRLPFENPREARKLGILPQGKRFEGERERLEALERNERVFKG